MLHEKSGSSAPLKRFRQAVKQLAESGELPDYDIGYSSEKDMVLFLRRTRGDHVAEDLGVYIPI